MNWNRLAALALCTVACGSGAPELPPAHLVEPPGMPMNGTPRKASKPHPHLTYRGGRVLESAQYTNLYWGAYWSSGNGATDADHYDYFIKTMSSSARFLSVTQEYDQPGHTIGPGSFRGRRMVAAEPGKKVTDQDIRDLLNVEIEAGRAPLADLNQVYIVYLPPDTVVDDGTGLSCDKFCGYHSMFATRESAAQYIVMPHPDCYGCRFALLHDGIDLDDLNRDSTTIVLSHEMIESSTDPQPGSGWYDDANGEISDICGGNDGYFEQGELLGFRVQKHWSNADDKCQLERTIAVPTSGGCPNETHAQGSVCVPDIPAGCSSAGAIPPLAVLLAGVALFFRRRAA